MSKLSRRGDRLRGLPDLISTVVCGEDTLGEISIVNNADFVEFLWRERSVAVLNGVFFGTLRNGELSPVETVGKLRDLSKVYRRIEFGCLSGSFDFPFAAFLSSYSPVDVDFEEHSVMLFIML